ncbi:MAG: alkaline phosphatase family protein [Gemmatimonadaceae bacterium]
MNHPSSVIVVLADGARPDTLATAIASGELPALARLSAEGGFHTVATVFPSVTGPAYSPFLMGRHPGSVGLPGLRWYDRSHVAGRWPSYARSYIGYQCLRLDGDLGVDSETIFELEPSSIGALSVIRRGLPPDRRIGSGAAFVARTAITHFRGRVAGWLEMDRRISEEFVSRVADERPAFAFVALTGIDKASHALGHGSGLVHDAMRIVDRTCAELRANAERNGNWDSTHLWVVSDHGHSSVSKHEDLAGFVSSLGFRTASHPWIVRPGAEVAVAVSGNAMAHVYTGLANRERSFWPDLAPRWDSTAATILARDSVDLMLLPRTDADCEVRTRDRGSGIVSWGGSTYSYHPTSGDPLEIGEVANLTETEAFNATMSSNYPDSLVQISRLSSCARSGDIILSAAPDWDFRARYEPIPHVSSHGSLHREHMLVPLITNRVMGGTPRRTVDVMASACAALGLNAATTEGSSFI